MKHIMILIGTLTFSQFSLAAAHICKIKEQVNNKITNVVVSTHTIEIRTSDKISLDLAFSGKHVELQRTEVEENLELVTVVASELSNRALSEGGLIMGETTLGEGFSGKSISVNCTKEK